MKTGIANLPLHYGKAPSWLFQRMKTLARQITIVIVDEFGAEEMLRKLADPFWFQALGSLLGFDWHSSGLTTTACGALKEGIRGLEKDLGLFIAGGKGGTSRKTPGEIEGFGKFLSRNPQELIYASRMSAKVDSTAVQDGYQIYHHSFFFTREGSWCVVQQGMNVSRRYARRYHWLGEALEDFVCEPHSAICCEQRGECLNMVARESGKAREVSSELAKEKPERLIKELARLKSLELPSRHQIVVRDMNPERLKRIFLRTYEVQPPGFESLLGIKGVGPKSIRALSLISELIYGASPSFQDPARFSFAHGGKDGHPYPVDRKNYNRSIAVLEKAVSQARIGRREKLETLKRLGLLYSQAPK
jgi:hypothetical protein